MRKCLICLNTLDEINFSPKGRGFMRACRNCIGDAYRYDDPEVSRSLQRIANRNFMRAKRAK